jgi:uncharacterized protein YcbK (DUF882 family)
MGDLSTNFSRYEFECKCGCGLDSIDYETLAVLEDIRGHFAERVDITSSHRCQVHNINVGGLSNSQHLRARAADIKVNGVEPEEVQRYLLQRYPNIYGIGCYQTFTHIDTRKGRARW